MAYAENTTVSFEKSVGETIELVRRRGADQIGQMEYPDRFEIGFKLSERLIRFVLPLPSIGDIPMRNGRGSALDLQKRQELLAQAKRQRGRALMLAIKAKLESVESGIETIEEAFLANIVMADGQTVYERISRPIELEYAGGQHIALLPER